MKKITYIFFSFILVFLVSLTIILSSTGIKTKKFNNFISQKINQSNEKLKLNFKAIKFKLDLREVSLFLETEDPRIYYRDVLIPTKKIKVYVDFLSIIKSNIQIKKITLNLNRININQLKNLSKSFKPSNLKSLINNKLKQGEINSEIEFFLDDKNLISDFIARGTAENLSIDIIDDIELKDTSFSFFADRTDVLVKNFFSKSNFFLIEDGDLRAELSPEVNIVSNFKSILKINDEFKKLKKLFPNLGNFKSLSNVQASLNNNLTLNFDKTYKLINFNYKNNGKITKADLNLEKYNLDYFSNRGINQLSLINSEIETNFNSKKNFINISGQYSLNKGNILNFNMSNSINKDLLDLKLTVDFDEILEFNILNYIKNKGKVAKIKFDLTKKNGSIKINEIDLTEGKNSLTIKGAKLSNKKIISLDELLVKTYKDNKKNNDFSIKLKKKILIKGNQFDASNLTKFINQSSDKNLFSKISKDIEIDFSSITIPVSEKLKNFKLIGRLEYGKFVKITSKGDFGNNNFLDITMKNDTNNKKKYLEIYSDVTKPLLTEYSFFKGLTGGRLLFSSIIEKNFSSSKLKIEDFKVINAPGMIKLLSLADLGGLADLAEGEGITFDTLEIKMEKNKKTLNLKEILALGPSISVLMEGYQDQNVTSLRGTLVPAKTLNTMISKIPVIGDIVIPKEVGEGLFGISFKMKGPPGKIKTTINPIRTITPRFIQKIIDRKKNSK